MTPAEAYQEEMAALLGILAQPVEGLHLLEFATIPQLEEILASVRPLCGSRPCLEIQYDPPHESPALLIERLRAATHALTLVPPPLIILRPTALPDATTEGAAVQAFWKALNYRREAIGDLHAQILLCVDPWHLAHVADVALDLLSWLMPRFHLIPPADATSPRMEMLTATLVHAGLADAARAAESRWETFWPVLESLRHDGSLPPSAIRRHVFPLLESTLAAGNLVRARQVRDAATGTPIPPEDLVQWHRLNALLACGAGEASVAELHAAQLLNLMDSPDAGTQADEAAYTLIQVSNILSDSGLHASAARFDQRLVNHFTTLRGPEHPQTLSSRNNLANALDAQGKHTEAEAENRAVLALRERLLGPEHPDTLSSRNNLASALGLQGKYAEAEAEFRDVLALRERVLGPEHPDTLMSRNNLANALFGQGKHAEAVAEYRAVLALLERVLGPEHPDTLMSRNNFAGSLGTQGKHAEAEAEFRAVLALRERVLGPEHPEVFQSCFNLSLTLERLGRMAEALEQARRALAGWTKVLGENHPDSQDAKRRVARLEQQ
jgi:tetratricopeptide (TPR) repeat protein